MISGRPFRLQEPLHAVRLGDEHKGQIIHLAAGSVVTLRGPSDISGFVEVLHENEPLNVFREDLELRAEKLPLPS